MYEHIACSSVHDSGASNNLPDIVHGKHIVLNVLERIKVSSFYASIMPCLITYGTPAKPRSLLVDLSKKRTCRVASRAGSCVAKSRIEPRHGYK